MDVNIIQVLFTFVSGEIAKVGPDAMTVYTPLRDGRDPGHENRRTCRCRGLREYVLSVAKRRWIDQRYRHYKPVRCGAANSFVAGRQYDVHEPIRAAVTAVCLVASSDAVAIRRGVADTERGPAILSNPSAESAGSRPGQSARR